MTRAFVNSLPKSGTNAVQSILVRMPGMKEQRRLGLNRSIRHHPLNLLPIGRRRVKVGVKSPVDARLSAVRMSFSFLREGRFALGHVPYDVEVEQLLLIGKIRPIIVVRDPRDVVLSSVHYVIDNPNHFMNSSLSRRRDLADSLMSVIQGGTTDDGLQFLGIGEQIKSIIGWVESPNCLTVRFEDIIGPRGNGSVEAQAKAIRSIAHWLDIDISNAQVEEIGNEMFGKGRTFRAGKTDGWKSVFTGEVEACFADAASEWVTHLGY